MPIDYSFKRKTKKLIPREWASVREMWLNFPDAGSTPGQCPTIDIGELTDVGRRISETKRKQPNDIDEEVPGLREAILKDAVFCLQKAAYFLVSAGVEATDAFRSPALSTAYQAAFFGMRSVVGLLGVAAVRYQRDNRRSFLIDAFSEGIPGRKHREWPRNCVRIVNAETSVMHKEMWAIWKRLLDKTRFEPSLLPSDVVVTLLERDELDFGSQRHRIHYHATYWPFDELRDTAVDKSFGRFRQTFLPEALAAPEDDSFSFALALGTILIGEKLLEDIAKYSRAFDDDLQAYTQWFSQVRTAPVPTGEH